ncbi:MAG: phosphatidate cytidylyltransferase [Bacteroidaceae bacterium]|nr:phosphatidate cytidylyltransferase [Bacteroidaceae bacterium]
MKKFIVRTLAGALFAAVLIGAILYGWSSFTMLFLPITAFSLNELCMLLKKHRNATFSTPHAVICGMLLFSAFAALGYIEGVSPVLLFAPYIIAVMYVFITRLFLPKVNALEDYAYFALTQLYVALPLSLLNLLASAGAAEDEAYYWLMPLSVFIFIWCNDSGAFCVGCTIGRHKMFERVSPKKTWEGFAGGVVVAAAAGVVMSHFFAVLNVWEWVGMALVVAVAGTLGDLVESSMKREMQIKDSGKFLPGHGGFLDRFDSTLLAVPAVVLYFALLGVL